MGLAGRHSARYRGKPFFLAPPMTGFSCQGVGRHLEAKNRPWGRFFNLYAGSGLTRAIPGARPAGGLWPSSRAILPACRTVF